MITTNVGLTERPQGVVKHREGPRNGAPAAGSCEDSAWGGGEATRGSHRNQNRGLVEEFKHEAVSVSLPIVTLLSGTGRWLHRTFACCMRVSHLLLPSQGCPQGSAHTPPPRLIHVPQRPLCKPPCARSARLKHFNAARSRQA